MIDICEHGYDRSLVDQNGTPLCDRCERPPWQTVPWFPDARGEEISGRTLRALRLCARLALERGWSAATLQARRRWNEPSTEAALTRVAVRLGLIP